MTSARLLLVDDEDGIRTVLSLLLADMGHDVRTAAGGEEALRLLAASPVDVVLTDVRMPGMDGLAVLSAVREAWPATEVIMLTGHGDMELAVKSLRLGATDFLTKPVSDAALSVALERAFERRRLREALRRHTEHLEELVVQRTRELAAAERLAGMGQTAAMLAHAIKNIAGSLEGGLYVLGKGIELDRRDYLAEGWELVRDHVARVRDLALHLLDLGRPLTGPCTPVDPDAPAEDVVRLLEARAAQAGVTLLTDLHAGPVPLVLDGEAVRRALTDLVVNGIEAFSLPGARAAGRQVRVSAARVRWHDGREAVGYTVSDNGPGLVVAEEEAGKDGDVAVLLAGLLGDAPGVTQPVADAAKHGTVTTPFAVDVAGPAADRSVSMNGAVKPAGADPATVVDREGAPDVPPVSGMGPAPGPSGRPGTASGTGGVGEDQHMTPWPSLHSMKPGGSGVGLLTVRRIAHELGGEMRAGTSSQGGCEMTLLLPSRAPVR